MNLKSYLLGLMILTLASCSAPVDLAPLPTALTTATPQPALIASPTITPASPSPTIPVPTSTPAFCDDPRGLSLIKSFSAAIASKDGLLLSSLVSPSKGLDVRYYRDGNIVNYDVEHAKFVFETTFQADWGLSIGSGQATLGSFQEIILPTLQQVFTSNAGIVCNQLKVGGTTYQAQWPYPNMDYFSTNFPGTEEFGGLDWQTWAVGMDNLAGNPYLAALVHYVWEP